LPRLPHTALLQGLLANKDTRRPRVLGLVLGAYDHTRVGACSYSLVVTASEPGGYTLNGLEDFYLKSKAIIWPSLSYIWPSLSYMCHNLALTVLYVPHNLALTVLYVPYMLDCLICAIFARQRTLFLTAVERILHIDRLRSHPPKPSALTPRPHTISESRTHAVQVLAERMLNT